MNGSARCISYDSGASLSDMKDDRPVDMTGWWRVSAEDIRQWVFCFAYLSLLWVIRGAL